MTRAPFREPSGARHWAEGFCLHSLAGRGCHPIFKGATKTQQTSVTCSAHAAGPGFEPGASGRLCSPLSLYGHRLQYGPWPWCTKQWGQLFPQGGQIGLGRECAFSEHLLCVLCLGGVLPGTTPSQGETVPSPS